MGKYIVTGGNRLSGEIITSGAKNGVLPILAALPLVGSAQVKNVPFLTDVSNTIKILEEIGIKIYAEGSAVSSERGVLKPVVPQSMSGKMRSSVLFMGSLLSQCGEVTIAYPGGCALGERPINLHLWAMEKLGANIIMGEGGIYCCTKGLKGTQIDLPMPSVGVTENIILASALADGVTIIKNAAREPEIADLCLFLNKCGADISGFGSSEIRIDGVKELKYCSHSVVPDRIEAATYMIMAAATGGELFVRNVNIEHLSLISEILRKTGCIIKEYDSTIYIEAPDRIYALPYISTAPYPAFPTDVQPQLMALMSIACGCCVIEENIFSGRYKHAYELNKMGAHIDVEDNKLFKIKGGSMLKGTAVRAWDLRGGAALLTAGLCAEGTTVIENKENIDRGYEAPICKIMNIGGIIEAED